jgi:hypothetical protein
MGAKRKKTWVFVVAVILMLLAIWAYLASLDESEPLTQTLPDLSEETQNR